MIYNNSYNFNFLKKILTIYEKEYMSDEKKEINYFLERENYLELPRFFPKDYYLPNNKNFIFKDRNEGIKININYDPTFSYRGDNYDYVKKSLLYDSCIIKRPPGKGKTVIGAGIIIERKIKTLIIVNMTTIIKQWKDAIIMASDLKPERINCNKLFHVNNFNEYDIYITTIQSLVSKINKYGIDYVKEYLDNLGIGLVLMDEVHLLVGPEKFSLVLFTFKSKYWVALSATPFKENQRDFIINWWLGNNLLGMSDYDIIPTIYIVPYYSGINKRFRKDEKDPYTGEPIKNYYRYIMYGNKFFRDRYFKILFKQRNFLQLNYSLIYKNVIDNRQVLFLTHFNKGGVNIFEEYIKKINDEIIINNFDKFISSDIDLERIKNKKVILSNYKKFSTAINVPTLDTLILSTPLTKKYELEQSIGRTLRQVKNMKKKVIVYDIVDMSFYEKSLYFLKSRMEFYNEAGFIVYK